MAFSAQVQIVRSCRSEICIYPVLVPMFSDVPQEVKRKTKGHLFGTGEPQKYVNSLSLSRSKPTKRINTKCTGDAAIRRAQTTCSWSKHIELTEEQPIVC